VRALKEATIGREQLIWDQKALRLTSVPSCFTRSKIVFNIRAWGLNSNSRAITHDGTATYEGEWTLLGTPGSCRPCGRWTGHCTYSI